MADGDIATKLCTRCGLTKPYADFNKNAQNTSTGLQSKCRACQKEVRHDWYMRNREREIAKTVEWAKQNPEKAREKDRRRHAKKRSMVPLKVMPPAKATPLQKRCGICGIEKAWKLFIETLIGWTGGFPIARFAQLPRRRRGMRPTGIAISRMRAPTTEITRQQF